MKLSREKGFTLIELLVVISIIALLSSVVFASITVIRTKARNSATNSLVTEYQKAIQLDYENKGYFPDPGTLTKGTKVCLGNPPSGESACEVLPGPDTVPDTVFNSILSNYLTDLKNPNYKLFINPGFGAKYSTVYRCNTYFNDLDRSKGCKIYEIIWYLEGTSAICKQNSPSGGATITAPFPLVGTVTDIQCTYYGY